MLDIENLNFYEILGISCDATQEEIKNAFRKQAKKYHPDINPQADALVMMQRINEAYETLSDLEKRKAYDSKIKSTTGIKQENKAYDSYTKTREESEEDLEEWLIIYLNYRRRLENLYLNGIKACSNKYPTMKETIKLEFIKEAIAQTLEDFIQEFTDNPLIALQLLLMELSDYITKTYDSNTNMTNGFVNIAIITKAFDKLLNKSLNGKNARDIIIYLINLFLDLDKKHKLRKDQYIKFLRDFVLKALKKNKDYVYNILGINEDDLKL